MTLLPEVDEKSPPKRQLAPTFKPYDNHQIQTIFDIESLIPENHVARVVDEMVEAVPNEQLFSHSAGFLYGVLIRSMWSLELWH